MRDIETFLLRVGSHLIIVMGGGALIVLMVAWEHYNNRNLSWNAYVYILLASLFIACYLAWRDEMRGRAGAEQRLDAQVQSAFIRKELGKHIDEGFALLSKLDAREVNPPLDRAGKWTAKVEEFISEHLGETYLTRLNTAVKVPRTPQSQTNLSGSTEHQRMFLQLSNWLYRLNEFLREFS